MSDRECGSTDRGSATLLTVVAGSLVVLAALVGSAFGGALLAHHRADGVADLSALAAAAALTRAADPCSAAQRVVAASGARLVACTTAGADVEVTVAVPSRLWRLGRGDVLGRARAGPAVPASATPGG